MTEQSLERRYVNGAWRWVVREENGGGTGNPDAVVRVVKVDGVWPDRPDVAYVEWVGPAPAPPADADADTWVETGIS